MSNGAKRNYKACRSKNHWRRWLWNRIVERLAVPPSQAVVVYLAGRDDLDRPIARDNGFRDENLIPVECDPEAAKVLRAKGRLVIERDLFDACESWKGPVHVLLADMCCNYTKRITAMAMKLSYLESFSNAVIAANIMKGREGWRGDWACWRPGEHRGRTMCVTNVQSCIAFLKALDLEITAEQEKSLLEYAEPASEDYISDSSQPFDSCVWRNCSPWKISEETNVSPQLTRRVMSRAIELMDAEIYQRLKVRFDDVSGHIAAIKAHRTMRMQAA